LRFLVVSTSFGERVFLRVNHNRYGLTRDPSDAAVFPNKVAAGMAASRAGIVIMRMFEAIEVSRVRDTALTTDQELSTC
jgi:hypothetical protein